LHLAYYIAHRQNWGDAYSAVDLVDL
jgi:hypothetical protein